MLKSTVLLLSALLAGSVSAKLNIRLPDKDSVWCTNAIGMVQWNSSATEFGLLCDIQLIDVKTQEVALNLTNSSIPCSVDVYNTSTLPAFDHSKFTVRIGENNNVSVWSYTQNFKILPASKKHTMTSPSHNNQTMIDSANNQTMVNYTQIN